MNPTTVIFGQLMNLNIANDLILKYSKIYDLPSKLLQSVCLVESGMNPYAIRFEPGWKYFKDHEIKAKQFNTTIDTMRMMYATSFGLCQVMGAVYYDFGGTGFATQLIDPEVNISYASRILKKIYSNHPSFSETYAIYNAGKLSYNSKGELVNKKNVDRFNDIVSRQM